MRSVVSSWHEFSVITYLDLIFWAETSYVKINQYVIAQTLFPEACGVGSDIDPLGKLKTTKRKADQMMSYDMIKLLELQSSD